MAHIDVHCQDCKRLLGKHYNDVHMWIDHMAGLFPIQLFQEYHRTFRHNSYGLNIIRSKFGPEAEIAGKIHLVRDCEDWLCPLRFDGYSLEEILEKLPKCLVWLNDPMNMDPMIHGYLMQTWIKDKKSFIEIALGR